MRRLGRHLGAIALLALLVRAVMPAGYMIAAADTPHGRYLTVALCGDHQGQSQVIDLDTGKLIDASDVPGGTPKDKSSTHQPCVFASAPHFAMAATPVGPIVFRGRSIKCISPPPQICGLASASQRPRRLRLAPQT